MKLDAIIKLVDRHYPDDKHSSRHLVLGYWNPDKRRARERPVNGQSDTLALFLVRELQDTYDEDADDKEQLAEAIRAVKRAEGDLASVRRALEEAHQHAKSKVVPFRRKT